MDLWSSLTGMVGVKLTSADLRSAMQGINRAGIDVYYVRRENDLTLRFAVRRTDYKMLCVIAEKHGDRLVLDSKNGLYWAARTLLCRPVLLTGLLIMISLSLYLPTRVLFIQIDGNNTIPSKLIAEKAAQCGIGFGASRREVRSEKMKNTLLQAIPELQWAGINTSGCTAVISVRERTVQNTHNDNKTVSSIVAARDGVIRNMTVLRGNPVCKVGQAVKEGQVLVSGYVDLGICIRATPAEAEVYAETSRHLTSVIPAENRIRTEITGREKKYSLIIGKKQINFSKGSGISDATCVKMKTVDYLMLPGGFSLPIALVSEESIHFEHATEVLTEEDASQILHNFSYRYLPTVMVAGSIHVQKEAVSLSDDAFRQTGEYACYEMIGKTKHEENLDSYGQID